MYLQYHLKISAYFSNEIFWIISWIIKLIFQFPSVISPALESALMWEFADHCFLVKFLFGEKFHANRHIFLSINKFLYSCLYSWLSMCAPWTVLCIFYKSWIIELWRFISMKKVSETTIFQTAVLKSMLLALFFRRRVELYAAGQLLWKSRNTRPKTRTSLLQKPIFAVRRKTCIRSRTRSDTSHS